MLIIKFVTCLKVRVGLWLAQILEKTTLLGFFGLIGYRHYTHFPNP